MTPSAATASRLMKLDDYVPILGGQEIDDGFKRR